MTDLLYTDVEEDLRASVRGVVERRLGPDRVAAVYDAPETDFSPLWKELAQELGLSGLLVPEELDGVGAGLREAAVVVEELGRAVAPVPFLTSAVVATTALLAAGDRAWLPRLASGELTATLVVPWSARGGGATATGPVGPVAGAVEADLFLVPVQDGGSVSLRAFERDAVTVTPRTSLDMTRPLAEVTWSGAGEVVAEGTAAGEAVEEAVAVGAALLASEQYAVARWCLESTVEYARTRIQFARPIGSFQAIKHRLADVYLEVVQAQAAARYAADTWHRRDEDRFVALAVAQAYCSQVAVHAAEESLQFHGGIGMTWEHPMHLYLKRAKADQLALGTPSRHRADLGALVGIV